MMTAKHHSDKAGPTHSTPQASPVFGSCPSHFANDLTGYNFAFKTPHVTPCPVSHILLNPKTGKEYERIECSTPGCKKLESKFYMRNGLCSDCQIRQARATFEEVEVL